MAKCWKEGGKTVDCPGVSSIRSCEFSILRESRSTISEIRKGLFKFEEQVKLPDWMGLVNWNEVLRDIFLKHPSYGSLLGFSSEFCLSRIYPGEPDF